MFWFRLCMQLYVEKINGGPAKTVILKYINEWDFE